MKRYLEHLRQKPEHVRQKYAYGIAGGITLAIFMMWGVHMVISAPLAYRPDPGARDRAQTTTSDPIAELRNTFQTGFAGVTASFEAIQQATEPGRYEGEARLEVVGEVREEAQEEVLTF